MHADSGPAAPRALAHLRNAGQVPRPDLAPSRDRCEESGSVGGKQHASGRNAPDLDQDAILRETEVLEEAAAKAMLIVEPHPSSRTSHHPVVTNLASSHLLLQSEHDLPSTGLLWKRGGSPLELVGSRVPDSPARYPGRPVGAVPIAVPTGRPAALRSPPMSVSTHASHTSIGDLQECMVALPMGTRAVGVGPAVPAGPSRSGDCRVGRFDDR